MAVSYTHLDVYKRQRRTHGCTDLRGKYGRRQTIFLCQVVPLKGGRQVDIQGQGSLFLCCLLLGGGMGLVYDGMRLARRILPHGVWAVQIEDGLYWAAVALGLSLIHIFVSVLLSESSRVPFYPCGRYVFQSILLLLSCKRSCGSSFRQSPPDVRRSRGRLRRQI